MARDEKAVGGGLRTAGHAPWVRLCHWIVALSVLTLAVSGVVILMAHPRLYWGNVGNDLTPSWLELPISRNYQHGGWAEPLAFSRAPASRCQLGRSVVCGPTTSSTRTAGPAACTSWWPGSSRLALLAYLTLGLLTGHLKRALALRGPAS